ncbi:hypothetical protein DIURU_001678 [Diutina rugosa]|uniref:Mannan endo-1,6-alpha-mannosidase n=1 Tax=Diutina rugosa TaxID=5481 RepID=A0A642UVP7_DIURU|nr:uncharacterized protein DIURU_001678 [Diutina rugosa]KAA8905250.1 hypothetical protein DIURU_001678 [Diutina rugosa]
MVSCASFAIVASLMIGMSQAFFLDTNNKTNVIENLNIVAKGLMDYYQGDDYGGVVGMFHSPYYWWEAGGAWGSLIDYVYYTQNDTLKPTIMAALNHQTGDDNNYIPLNQSTTEGNDDQGFWGIAVMAAAEKNFGTPDDDKKAYLALAQGVFNTMASRWDESACGGGLRWQIFQWNSGYDYKNSVSNGCLFHIAARLARYTGNTSYSDWAEKVYDWMTDIQLLNNTPDFPDHWFVYDGIHADTGGEDVCHNMTKYQWTYNQGLFLSGCAYMYNFTGEEKWRNRTLNLLTGAEVFFNTTAWKGSWVMQEAACQRVDNCNNDQRSFKAYFARFLGLTSLMMPETSDKIRKWLVDSANAAAGSCSGGTDGVTCGLDWTLGHWDGKYGLGEQMCALEVMNNLLIHEMPPPYTADNGGTSVGNPAGGFGTKMLGTDPLKLNGGDTAGASIITALVGVSIIGAGIWLLV